MTYGRSRRLLRFAWTAFSVISLAYCGSLVTRVNIVQANDNQKIIGQQAEDIISGEVVQGGVECPLFKTDEGRLFSLASITIQDAPLGLKMKLRGHQLEVSTCMQGTTFLVSERLE